MKKHWILRFIATFTAGALIITAPGLDCYRVLAAGMVEVPVTAGNGAGGVVVPVGGGANFNGGTNGIAASGALLQRGGLGSAQFNGGKFNGAYGRGNTDSLRPSPGLRPTSPLRGEGNADGLTAPETTDENDAVTALPAPAAMASVREATEKLREALSQKTARPEALRSGSSWENLFKRGSNGMAPQEPAAGGVGAADLLAASLIAEFKPGAAMKMSEVEWAWAKAGLSQQEGLKGVVGLVARRSLIELPGNRLLMAIPAASGDPAHQRGADLLRAALRQYDPASPAALAAAIHGLDAARKALTGAPEDSAGGRNRRLAVTAMANASVRLFDRLADSLTTGSEAEKAVQKGEIAELRSQYLSQAYYSLNENGPKPTKRSIAILASLVDGLPSTPRNGQEVSKGTAVMKQFVMSLKPGHEEANTARPLALPSPQARETDAAAFDIAKFKTLSTYGVDLTQLAREGKLKQLIGREKELGQVVESLARWTKNNPVLIGEHGVGKTQIVDGLAQKVAAGEVASLKGKAIVRLDLGALIAGTVNRGMFEERVVALLKEVKESNGQVLLFIDELHKIVGLGAASSDKNDAGNMIKEALQNGDLTVIGATTLDEYRAIEKDGALERRFIPIRVQAPGREDTLKILAGVAPKIAAHNRVAIAPEALAVAVDLSDKYLTERYQPDKAIDLLVAAAAYVQLQGLGEVTPEHMALKVSEWTGVPAAKLTESDREALKTLEAAMKARVIHQDEAIAAVAAAVRRARLGYTGKKRPKGRFLFSGPTGVGKTEVGKVLAEQLFGSRDALLRIDMSEYMDKESVARFIGAPPGYIGHDQPGQLTEAVRRRPYQVVMFDEIEKAHPKVLDILLQILEEGSLSDGQGHKVDFSNTYVILTTNAGSEVYQAAPKREIGFHADLSKPAASASYDKQAALEAIRAAFRPELLNRLDTMVAFNRLDRGDVTKILDIMLADLHKELADKRFTIEPTAAAKDFLITKGFDPRNGARPLERAIAEELKNRLVDAELDGVIKEGDRVKVDVAADGTKLVVSPVRPPAGPSSQAGFITPVAALALMLVAAPFVTFAVVSYGSLTIASALPSGMFLPAVALFGLMPFLQYNFKNKAPVGGPVGAAVAKGAAIALSLDLATKAFAALVLPRLFPGYEVMTHVLGIGSSLAATGAAALMVAGFGFAQQMLSKSAGALRNPAAQKVASMQRWVTGSVIGVTLGQVAEGWLRGGVIDWIYVGGIVTNFADLAVWVGVVYTFMSTLFLVQAQRSEKHNAPITMPSFAVYAPVFGVLAAAFASGLLIGAPMAVTMFIYSFFLGVGVLVSDSVMHFMVRQYNQAYRESAVTAATGGGFVLPWTFRLNRQVRAFLAGTLGLVSVGAPRLPAEQAQQLLLKLQKSPPKLIVMDYDSTLQTNNGPRKGGTFVSPEMVLALDQVQKAGSILAVATDRNFDDPAETPEDDKSSISKLLVDQLKPETRREMLVAVMGGGEIYQYNRKGDKPKSPVLVAPPFSQNEQQDMSDVVRNALAEQGVVPAMVRASFSGYKLTLIPSEKDEAGRPVAPPDMDALGAKIRKGMAEKALHYSLEVRTPNNPTLAKYIVIRKTDKSASILGILKTLAEQGIYVDASEVLILGDETARDGLDLTMAKAVPQATMISVGKKLDPRVSNAYLWPETGPLSTLKILRSIGEHYAERNPEHVFSFSQISLRERSPREFKERYKKGAHKNGRDYYKEPLPAFVGTRAHETMHWLYAKGIPGRDMTRPNQQQELIEKAEEVYKKLWEQNWDSDRVDADALPYDGLPESLKDLEKGTAKDRQLVLKRYKDHGWAFVSRYIQKYMPFNSDKSIGMEHRIFFHIQGPLRKYLFQAIVDRASLSKDGYLEIHEYKTGRTPTVEAFKDDLQMPLYAIGMRETYSEYRRLRVRFVRHGPDTDLVWEPTEAELESARLRLAARAEEILQDLGAPEGNGTLSPDPSLMNAGGEPAEPDAVKDPNTLSRLHIPYETFQEKFA